MPKKVGLREYLSNFDFEDLNRAVSGSFNKGELRLNEIGELETINNHIYFRLANIRSNSPIQNYNVRMAVASTLRAQFGEAK